MLNREDMLEITRSMTPKRASVDSIAGCYFDQDGDVDGTFNKHFLRLTAGERDRNLKIAKTIPFSETNKQLTEMVFPGKTKQSKEMNRLLLGMKECGLKNDALMDMFYDVVSEQLNMGVPYAILVFHGIYDIPLMASDKEEQWESDVKDLSECEQQRSMNLDLSIQVHLAKQARRAQLRLVESEEVYEYMICAIAPVYGDYEVSNPVCGFLYPSFKDRSTDESHIALFETDLNAKRIGLRNVLGCEEH